MKCGFCGKEIPEEVDKSRESCGACPGGCRKVHCPWCGYANPLVPDYLRRLERKPRKKE